MKRRIATVEAGRNPDNKMTSNAESMDTGESGRATNCGGCEGPNAMYVKLISSDGHEFVVKREHALISGTIKAMLSGPGQFAENETNEVNFRYVRVYIQFFKTWRFNSFPLKMKIHNLQNIEA